MIEQYLLSHEDMEKKGQSLSDNYEYPYFYSIQNKKQILDFLGIRHIYNDSNNQQVNRIIKLWNEFLFRTEKKPQVVIIEGKISPVSGSETQEEVIKLDGERGLMTYLSNKEHIEIINGEPSWEYKTKELLKVFTKEEILYNFFCVAVYSWNKLKNEKTSLKDYVEPLLAKYKEKSQWQNVEFSYSNMVSLHDKKNTHKFSDTECKKCAYEEIHPAKSKFANAESVIRNVSLVETIIKQWKAEKSIFIVYGTGHAFVCEPALKKLLT